MPLLQVLRRPKTLIFTMLAGGWGWALHGAAVAAPAAVLVRVSCAAPR